MKFLILAVCVCSAYAASAPRTSGFRSSNLHAETKATASVSGDPSQIPIIRSDSQVNPDGFSYSYETGNGIQGQEEGSLKKVEDLNVITVRGSYQYVAPDGTPVLVSYVADENGFQPQSDLLPVAPPVPVAIARALEYIAAHPPAPENVRRA